ncbi:TrlF family AAA-like ATPase [Acinetobacter baumannii]
MNRGSEWGRWDLHVHTKDTAKNDKFKNISFDEYCIELFKRALEKDIKAIGITDYFSVKNYKRVKDFQNNINDCNFFTSQDKDQIKKIFILPNIELRTTPSTDRGSAINFHLLINPEAVDEYENRFTDNLIFTVTQSEKYKLSEYDLIKLGRKEKQNDKIEDEVALKAGISAFILNPSDIINAFNEYPSFRNHCIVAVSNDRKDGASAFQGHEKLLSEHTGATLRKLRESIYKVADIIFSPRDTEFFLGKSGNSPEEYLNYYGSYKACVHGSDAHSIEELFNPTNDRFCFIKAEASFEGLKQILHEPATRVHIGPTKPEFKNEYEVIDYIELNNKNVHNNKIYFNSNLTSIIGGRSSGKSTLLQCIAKKLRPESLDSDSKFEHLDELCNGLKIVWQDGQEDNTRPIEYFYQGHMYKKSKGEGIEEIVINLLLQNNPLLYQEFDIDLAKIRHDISGNLSTLFSIKEQIDSKKEILSTSSKVKDIDAQIELLTKKINSIRIDNIKQEEVDAYYLQVDESKKLKASSIIYQNLKNQFISLSHHNFIMMHNQFLSHQGYELVQHEVEKTLKNINDYVAQEIMKLKLEQQKVLDAKISEIEGCCNKILFDPDFIRVQNSLIGTESLKPILDQREKEKKKREDILQIEADIEKLEESAQLLLQEVKESCRSIYNKYCDLSKLINNLKISDGLDIFTSLKFEDELFEAFMKKTINQQGEKAQSFTTRTASNIDELMDLHDQLIIAIENNDLKFKQANNLESFIKEFFDKSWFKLSYDVIYEKDNYNSMSQGKKAFVVLKMSLDCSDSKCPIIIDQPEDDLDNRAIYTELVTYLKEKKTQRQIILVTHNANVVVNADSELVIVANQHGSQSPNDDGIKFQYKYGSIECHIKSIKSKASTLDRMTIKEHICEILEGGDKAFKLREKKYNLLA